MPFEPIKERRGQPRVRCICEDCGRDEVVAAIHGKSGHEGDAQAASKLQRLGWTYIGKHLRCPACETKRKVVPMKKQEPKVEAPKEPSKDQKRQIVKLLDGCYDTDAERYIGGETDETVAEVLGVLPGWVANLREELYGPAGGNEDMEALSAELEQFLESATKVLNKATEESSALVAVIEGARGFRDRLAKIEKACGPRIVKKAGL